MLGAAAVILSISVAFVSLSRLVRLKIQKTTLNQPAVHIVVVVLGAAAVLFFCLTNNVGGEMVYYDTSGLVLAAVFVVQVILTAAAFLKPLKGTA